MQQFPMDLADSGTFDLAASYGKHDRQHIQRSETFGMDNQQSNVKKGFALEHIDDDLKASNDVFNLSSSGRMPLVGESEAGETVKKFSKIDHFNRDMPTQKQMQETAEIDHQKKEESERMKIATIIHEEREKEKLKEQEDQAREDKAREDREREENQLLERLTAGTRDLYQQAMSQSMQKKRPGSALSAKKALGNQTIETVDMEADEQEVKSVTPVKPVYPQFEEQLKEIREGYAKEYEERIKRGLQELSDLKSDISQKQEVFDSKQVRDLRREVKRYEDQHLESTNEKIELKKCIDQLGQRLKEKDTQIDQMMNGVQNQDGQNVVLKDNLRVKQLQIEAMMNKMDLMKRNIDDLNFKYIESQKLLDQMKSQDFAKQNLILKRQTAELTDALALKQKYLDDLKQNMKLAMQSISNTHEHEQQSAIFSNLLENLSQENLKSKRLTEELQKREGICQRKWNKLLQENLDLQDKVNGHNLQLQRTREQYQQIVQQNERKLLEANQRLAWLQNQEDKRSAAEYLVDQMRIVNEEKQNLVFDNQNLLQQNQELQYEFQRLERDLKDFMCFRQGVEYPDFQMNQDPVAINTQRLVQRVEELEDLVVELKSKQSANEVTELKHLVGVLELENLQNVRQIRGLQSKRMTSKDLFEKNDMHASYLSIMREREKVIEQLHAQLKKVGDQNVMRVQNQSFGGRNGSSAQSSNAQGTNAGGITVMTDEKSQKEPSHEFEEEKIKDAINFKNLMQTMNQSAGFANMRPEDKQNSRNAYQTAEEPAQNNSEKFNSALAGGNTNQANTGALFQNYDKSERDQWLLTGSQQME